MKSIPLAAEFIYLATSAESAGPINRPNRSQRINVTVSECVGDLLLLRKCYIMVRSVLHCNIVSILDHG